MCSGLNKIDGIHPLIDWSPINHAFTVLFSQRKHSATKSWRGIFSQDLLESLCKIQKIKSSADRQGKKDEEGE